MVRNGIHEPDIEPERFEIHPRHAKFDSVIIDNHSGSLSLDSVKWLARHGIPIFVLDYNGTLLSSILPREPVNGPLKLAQFATYNDPQKRMLIAKKLIEAKAQRTIDVLDWLSSRYDDLGPVTSEIGSEVKLIGECGSLPKLMQVEGHIADLYWRQLQRILPEKLGFNSRIHETRQMNASDPVNCLLNYGYAILESECRKALNSVGLELTVGFLHEARQTKYSLCYDLMEPYRFLADTTVIESLEYEHFNKKDFYRLDNYVLRLRPEAVKKLLAALQIKFNSTVQYRGKRYGWDTVMRLKCQELASYILAKRSELDFDNPRPLLPRDGSEAVRSQILSMSVADARELGIRKNTLWYIQQRARTGKPIKIYNRVEKKLQCKSA
jgi:CRISPR-associated protein Cas1